MSKPKILFQLSGSIACFKACQVISTLVQSGYEIQVVCTQSALKFVGPATLEGLTGRKVFSDIYETGQVMSHIDLAKWADLAIICPATANTINSLAHGLATDSIGSLFLAYDLKKPYLVAPAMNPQMLAHPATKAALAKLSEWGITVLDTGEGRHACGDQGEGRLLEPNQIVEAIVKKTAKFI
jgi:phosphopantothenoylcysteine synthetase/decarboxylase